MYSQAQQKEKSKQNIQLQLESIQRHSKGQVQQQRINANKLNEIAKQIKTILSQDKISLKKRSQAYRPQSDLLNNYHVGQNSILRAKKNISQNEISNINYRDSLNSVNSTNLQIRKNYEGFENIADDIRRGTDTERNYKNQIKVKDSILESLKQNQFSYQFKSYQTQNQQSQSQQSFRNQVQKQTEKIDSKSENTTSRNDISNNKIAVSNIIKERTPTKNLFNGKSFQNSSLSQVIISNSKISSLLSSITKLNRSGGKQEYQPTSFENIQKEPSLAHPKITEITNPSWTISVEDPNQTHIIVASKDFQVSMYNIYSQTVHLIGKHHRQITALSNIIFDKQRKLFYSGSRDNVIKQWSSESMHGNYRETHQFRIEAAPLYLLLDEFTLTMITANSVIRKDNQSLKIFEIKQYNGDLQEAIRINAMQRVRKIDFKLQRFTH